MTSNRRGPATRESIGVDINVTNLDETSLNMSLDVKWDVDEPKWENPIITAGVQYKLLNSDDIFLTLNGEIGFDFGDGDLEYAGNAHFVWLLP